MGILCQQYTGFGTTSRAHITREKNGHKTIQFTGVDGKRRSVRLGKMPQRSAETVKRRVESLIAARISGHAVDDETARWIAKLDQPLADKLAKAQLISSRTQATLGGFISSYISQHGPTVKPGTLTTWLQCERLLLEHFTPSTPLRSITEGHAIEWRNYLLTRDHSRIKRARKLSESTIRKRCACARQFFEHALRLGLIQQNPFKSKRIPTSLPKPKQKRYIEAELANKILDQLPNWQWRLLFALARWGGLRVPSEPQRLTWNDVDSCSMRLTVHSPKTEHHVGHEKRVIPIFPELVQPLQEAWDAAAKGQSLVLPMLNDVTGAALRKPLMAAIAAAGGETWEKLWVSLRATRDTELRQHHPVHVVEAWMGHEDRVSKRHYAQVTSEHFDAAIGGNEMSDADPGAGALQKAVQLALQNGVQHVHAHAGTASQQSSEALSHCEPAHKKTTACEDTPSSKVGMTGLEPALR